MACYHPLDAWRFPDPSSKSGFSLDFRADAPRYHPVGEHVLIPCGKCLGCRVRKARDWAVRCYLESKLHERNCFLTLTYDDDHLPVDNSVHKRDLQLFLKRLRKELSYYGDTIRYFACGEYGARLHRPHYHILVFGCDFVYDERLRAYNAPVTRSFFRQVHSGSYYTSPIVTRSWDKGFHLIADLTPASCSYVARYVTKKLRSKAEYGEKEPEFTLMSRRPGIAHDWYEKFGKYVRDHDHVHFGKVITRPPAYFDRLTELTDSEYYAILKERRRSLVHSVSQGRLNDLERLAILRNEQKKKGCLEV